MRKVAGVNIRQDPKRAAQGALSWGLYIELQIVGRRHRTAKFYATESAAQADYAAACAEVTALRAELEADVWRTKALAVPPLPAAPAGTVLFGTLATRWLEDYVKEFCAPGSYTENRTLLRLHLFPIMRTWPVTAAVMDTHRLKGVLKEQLHAKGVSLLRRRACQKCLCAFFEWANNELPGSPFAVNPAHTVGKYLRHKDEKAFQLRKDANPMTRTQVEAFLVWINEHYPQLYAFFLWLVDEGSRVGEVSALKDEHLDLDRGKAHIVESFSQPARWLARQQMKERGEIIEYETTVGEKGTKTHRSDQYIDLSARVVVAMRKERATNLAAWMAVGRPGKPPRHTFLNSRRRPRRPDKQVYRAFREACDALQLVGQTGKRFTIHCLRDTFATLSLLEGKPLGWVALQLGHASELTTKTFYYKWVRLMEENLLAERK
jgi:integrase